MKIIYKNIYNFEAERLVSEERTVYCFTQGYERWSKL